MPSILEYEEKMEVEENEKKKKKKKIDFLLRIFFLFFLQQVLKDSVQAKNSPKRACHDCCSVGNPTPIFFGVSNFF